MDEADPKPTSEERADAWLARDPLPADPFPPLVRWLDEAFAARRQPNPHAIALATVDPDGHPSVRMVLCKALEPGTGSLVFYTHLESRKGRALATHPYAAAVFYFGPQDRQARLAGPVEPVAPEEADAYFASRPLDARLGAWASAQSQPIASRDALEARLAEQARRFGVAPGAPAAAVPRPPSWSGFRLRAREVELWVSREGRLHDRVRWERLEGAVPGGWTARRLQP